MRLKVLCAAIVLLLLAGCDTGSGSSDRFPDYQKGYWVEECSAKWSASRCEANFEIVQDLVRQGWDQDCLTTMAIGEIAGILGGDMRFPTSCREEDSRVGEVIENALRSSQSTSTTVNVKTASATSDAGSGTSPSGKEAVEADIRASAALVVEGEGDGWPYLTSSCSSQISRSDLLLHHRVIREHMEASGVIVDDLQLEVREIYIQSATRAIATIEMAVGGQSIGGAQNIELVNEGGIWKEDSCEARQVKATAECARVFGLKRNSCFTIVFESAIPNNCDSRGSAFYRDVYGLLVSAQNADAVRDEAAELLLTCELPKAVPAAPSASTATTTTATTTTTTTVPAGLLCDRIVVGSYYTDAEPVVVPEDHQPRFWFENPPSYMNVARFGVDYKNLTLLTDSPCAISFGGFLVEGFDANGESLLGHIGKLVGRTVLNDFKATGIQRFELNCRPGAGNCAEILEGTVSLKIETRDCSMKFDFKRDGRLSKRDCNNFSATFPVLP